MLKVLKEMKENLLKFVNEKKERVVQATISICIIGFNIVGVSADEIANNLQNASNEGQQSVLGWVNAIGAVAIIAGAIVYFTGNEKAAKGILFCAGGGYILIRFAPQFWDWFTKIFS